MKFSMKAMCDETDSNTCTFTSTNTIFHKEKSNKMQECIKIFIIPYLHEAQHVSGVTPPIIRSLKLHWQPLVLSTNYMSINLPRMKNQKLPVQL